MTNEQAVKDRAKQIDPCAFRSYSGSTRRDAQNAALEQARRELENEPRGQRRYTLDEIDRMRVAIKRMDPFINPFNPANRPYRGPSVEDQLRTAMLGGVDPQELEDKADERWAAIRARREARRLEHEANVARTCVDGSTIRTTSEAVAAVVADVPMTSFWKRLVVSRIETILSRLKIGTTA